MRTIISGVLAAFFLASCSGMSGEEAGPIVPSPLPNSSSRGPGSASGESAEWRRISFAQVHPTFAFSGPVPPGWEAKYVPETQALHIFDPGASGSSDLDRSQIFIRTFTADRFLTLSTVTIHDREELTISGRPAVRYDIEKKPGVAPFANQPPWRSTRHDVVDIRSSQSSPSLFFVIARNPALDARIFEEFLDNLTFHGDNNSFQPPLSRFRERVTKKPFGIRIDPQTSPVQPERFRGIHAGTDFEIFEGETEVEIVAICTGKIRAKRHASGYGGLVVQQCEYQSEPITVLYGHLDLASIVPENGDTLVAGERIGILGEGGTTETDGERMHLHLGVHRGNSVNARGYVPSEAGLTEWIDPLTLLP